MLNSIPSRAVNFSATWPKNWVDEHANMTFNAFSGMFARVPGFCWFVGIGQWSQVRFNGESIRLAPYGFSRQGSWITRVHPSGFRKPVPAMSLHGCGVAPIIEYPALTWLVKSPCGHRLVVATLLCILISFCQVTVQEPYTPHQPVGLQNWHMSLHLWQFLATNQPIRPSFNQVSPHVCWQNSHVTWVFTPMSVQSFQKSFFRSSG